MALSSPPEATPIYLAFAHSSVANELNVVSMDHCYAKPWSTHPEASNAQPVRLLFMDPLSRQSSAYKARNEFDMIDVETEDKPVMPDYDMANARSMMSECERHAVLLRPQFAEVKDDWEEHIAAVRTTWSVLQNRLFAKVLRILQGDRLARLTIQETKNEPIQRRLQIDKAAKRVKFAFANVNWDMPLILWLHNLFLDNLRGQLLTSYLEILQTLKLKIPSLIEKLIEGTESKPGGLTTESLSVLLKRTWDPVLSSINQQKPKKLPGQSLLLVISDVASMINSPLATKRHKFWQHQLSFLGKVINVVPVNNSTAMPVTNCVENMVASTRSKILEMKGHFSGRPIVLVGFHIGSLVACQVALMEQVQAVVCLGYPTMGVKGNRGEIDDPVYNYKTPTLFVVGQHASSCSVDALEDVREKLKVDSGLVVVGGADDHLRMARAKKKGCGVTQAVVDRCVIDEVSNFLGNMLQAELSLSDSIDDVDIVKKASLKRKKMASAVVGVGSQTPGDLVNKVRIEKKSAKALKSSKQDPMLSSVGIAMDGKLLTGPTFTHRQTIPKLTKAGKRASPKKSSKFIDSDNLSAKRAMMQVNFKSSSLKKYQGQSSLSTRNEAAVIASAPELSNLLKSCSSSSPSQSTSSTPPPAPTPPPQTPTTSVTTLPSSFIPSSIQTTTSLNLTKLLSSSEFDRMLNSSRSVSSTEPMLVDKHVKNTAAPFTIHHPITTATSTTTENIPKKQEATQILIHTRDSPVPITFPVTFTMASKVLKSPSAAATVPMMKAVSATAGGRSVPSFTYDSNVPTPKVLTPSTPQTASVLQQDHHHHHHHSPSSSSALSTMLQGVVTSSNTTIASPLMKDSASISIPPSKSPLSSVINIGSDTVQMKETPPNASAPETVSIDLGQLSTSNNIVMKFGNPSKISLMPSLKPLSSSSPSSSSSFLLNPENKTSGVTVSRLMTQTKSTLAATGPVSVTSAVKTQPAAPLPVASSSAKPAEKNLTILSSSDLLSSLSSNTGLITFKLSTPANSSAGITLTPQKSSTSTTEKPQASCGGILKVLQGDKPAGVTSVPKSVTAMTFNPTSTVTLGTAKVSTKPLLTQHLQPVQKEESTTTFKPKPLPTSMAVIFATAAATKSNVTITTSMTTTPFSGHVTLQSASATSSSSAAGFSSTSHKTVLVSSSSISSTSNSGSSEVLGKVTSLLESSPVTVIDQPKTLSSLAMTDYTSTTPGKDSNLDTNTNTKAGVKSTVSSYSPGPSQSGWQATSTPTTSRASKSTVSSYTPTTKNVLPTVASTRTRRIKTPKQYDL